MANHRKRRRRLSHNFVKYFDSVRNIYRGMPIIYCSSVSLEKEYSLLSVKTGPFQFVPLNSYSHYVIDLIYIFNFLCIQNKFKEMFSTVIYSQAPNS